MFGCLPDGSQSHGSRRGITCHRVNWTHSAMRRASRHRHGDAEVHRDRCRFAVPHAHTKEPAALVSGFDHRPSTNVSTLPEHGGRFANSLRSLCYASLRMHLHVQPSLVPAQSCRMPTLTRLVVCL
ncbi:hypothetical protein JDV02_008825 [Purpureocillium takamizusanense]|uniref:Uncharacterized protein n=1 Tax=Purpureocillium takamizusanense TaxID=2060973 RepID=A0A9Q8VEU3_9HYPO|nr:uncharacterized protein JDV02_008825 [Purpureocillium takamizusanense]UNI22983.1 hypothetical protein JDV02_008825 [Purpureocillium takamizusanense]